MGTRSRSRLIGWEVSAFAQARRRDIRTEYKLGRRFVVMFAGNLGMVQGLDTIIDAAARMRESADVAFVFVGDGADRGRLRRLVAEQGLDNVHFFGHHSAAEMPAFLSGADALLVHLRRSDVADHAIPTKILRIWRPARPIVCARLAVPLRS